MVINSWTLIANLDKRIQAFEIKCYSTMIGISFGGDKTNEYVLQQELVCQSSSVASFHGSAMSAVTIRCQKSYYRELHMIVVVEVDRVNDGGTTSRDGQASHCRCCTS